MSDEILTEHPHIVRRPGVCGGSPIIRNTRLAVWLIVGLWKAGDTPEEIAEAYPHIRLAQVYDALSYYFDHQPEIEQEIEDNRIETVMAKHGLEKDKRGVLRPPGGKVVDGR